MEDSYNADTKVVVQEAICIGRKCLSRGRVKNEVVCGKASRW